MASPQPDQFTRISNELLEALARFRLPGEQMQCLLFIIRKTYGFGKKVDRISYGQIAKGTGLSRQNAQRAVQGLINKTILTVSKSEYGPHTMGVNKDYEKWGDGVLKTEYTVFNIEDTVIKSEDSTVLNSEDRSVLKTEAHKRKKEKKETIVGESAHVVLSYLNQVTGKSFKTTGLIPARLNDGATIEQCKLVIDHKARDPGFDRKYLDHTTLFRPGNFDRYLNDAMAANPQPTAGKFHTPEWV